MRPQKRPTPESRRIRKFPSEKSKWKISRPTNYNRAQYGRKPEFGPARVGWASTLMSNLPANQHQSEASHVGWRCCSPAHARLLVLCAGDSRTLMYAAKSLGSPQTAM